MARAIHSLSRRSRGRSSPSTARLPCRTTCWKAAVWSRARCVYRHARPVSVCCDGHTVARCFSMKLAICRFLLQPSCCVRCKTDPPVGSDHEVSFDVRVWPPPSQLAAGGAQRRVPGRPVFRLNVISISVPPLRERGDDILCSRIVSCRSLQGVTANRSTALPQASPASSCATTGRATSASCATPSRER